LRDGEPSNAVFNVEATSSPGSLAATQAAAAFTPGVLLTNTTYFWRVDEVTPSGVITGDVWTFTTLNPNASTVYEWSFDRTNLDITLGNGLMTYADAATPALTAFATTDGATVPHIGGQPARYLHVPAFTAPANGYWLTFHDSGPNGGGGYINRFTFIFDLFIPSPLNWTPLFNTNPQNANDADWYVDPTGRLGIGELGYSSPNAVAAHNWQRLAFVADLGTGVVTFYCNGSQVRQRTGASLLDGRFSLYSNLDGGPDVLLFNEGDTSGVYTHALYVNSIAFTDRVLSSAEIAALGGPRAEGIFVLHLTATHNGPDVLLTWNSGPNIRLQRSPTVSPANWHDVPGTRGSSAHTESVTNAAMFFRLAQP
jgi:hypothetical protein